MKDDAIPKRSAAYANVLGVTIAVGLLTAAMLSTVLLEPGFWNGFCGVVSVGVFMRLLRMLRLTRITPLLNTAARKLLEGDLPAAEKLLDELDRAGAHPIEHGVLVHRATIALRRGELDEAEKHFDRIIAGPKGRADINVAYFRVIALSYRQLIRASKGKAKEAAADGEAIRNELDQRWTRTAVALRGLQAFRGVVARSRLSEILVAERSGDRAKVRELLDASRDLLSDALAPRERAIVRAYERMLAAPQTTPYRVAPRRRGEHAEEPPLAEWIERIAPEAAAFVETRATTPGDARAEAAPAPPTRKVDHAKFAPKSRAFRLLAGGAAVVAAVYWFFTQAILDPHRGPAAGVSLLLASALIFPFLVVVLGLVVRRLVRVFTQRWAVSTAMLGVARGDAGQHQQELERLEGERGVPAAEAALARAELADGRGDFEAARRSAESGLGAFTLGERRMVEDIIVAELASARAAALAATDQLDAAREELAGLSPTYWNATRARFKVELIAKMRAGDFEGAAALASSLPADVPLRAREELLADLARTLGSSGGIGAAEQARIDAELRRPSAARAWVERIAPEAMEAFASSGVKRIAMSSAPDVAAEPEHRDALAEAEAHAEAEAEEDARRTATLRS